MPSNHYPLSFYKYTGCGNDFIIIDDRQGRIPATLKSRISELCNRHKGIGADGVILLQDGGPQAEAALIIYNADSSEAALCGNGLRCVIRCLYEDLNIHKDTYTVTTTSGSYSAKILGDEVEVSLGNSTPIQGPFRLEELPQFPAFSLVVGVPHVVIFCDDIEEVLVRKIGRSIRHNTHLHPEGSNVNFIQVLDSATIAIRTYERGVEDETLACGTGAAAAAIAAASYRRLITPIEVNTRGGSSLRYHFKLDNNEAKNIVMRGEAQRCFQGLYRLPLDAVYVRETETLREAALYALS
ncbi:MAG: diaminopimelate epimerase [Parachlamydiales bacterium]|jgi:diaminopimelate epimerase